MKKSILVTTAMWLTATAVSAQTISLKPDGVTGEDAQMWRLSSNCVPSGYPLTPADLNFGNDPELSFSAWTWSDVGCNDGNTRSLIRFTGLSAIPPGSTIGYAQLVLHTPATTLQWGNNLFPSTPLPLSNLGWVQRVLPGGGNPASPDNWNEQTVTWNTQPATDPNSANWVTIPVTNSRWNWNVSMDVTAMVQQIVNEMVSDPYANNGFLLRLITESSYYRQQVYASSDDKDCAMWPELIVTYRPRKESKPAAGAGSVLQDHIITSDDPSSLSFINKAKVANGLNKLNADNITITPNPTTSGWNINLSSLQKTQATVNVYDMAGKLISSGTQSLQEGSNDIYQSASGLASGIYFIEIKGEGINKKEKVVKN